MKFFLALLLVATAASSARSAPSGFNLDFELELNGQTVSDYAANLRGVIDQWFKAFSHRIAEFQVQAKDQFDAATDYKAALAQDSLQRMRATAEHVREFMERKRDRMEAAVARARADLDREPEEEEDVKNMEVEAEVKDRDGRSMEKIYDIRDWMVSFFTDATAFVKTAGASAKEGGRNAADRFQEAVNGYMSQAKGILDNMRRAEGEMRSKGIALKEEEDDEEIEELFKDVTMRSDDEDVESDEVKVEDIKEVKGPEDEQDEQEE